ncbi:MAG: hypothetical protein COV45_04835 [Deltaproteobacteria bacterium CG11_big_fil_rev_8_21_14_0_20_47_16]|nr:MAG: hypothetical protein COV45_04835 [Deltaproteobacteria bacterium CG11_big_fil_rev_8_21_14_0_20_47_16]
MGRFFTKTAKHLIGLTVIAVLTSACGAVTTPATSDNTQTASSQDVASDPTADTSDILDTTSDTANTTNTLELTSKSYVSSDDVILNPERGFYYWTDLLTTNYSNVRDLGYTLVYARLLLSNYTDKVIDDTMLTKIDDALSGIRQAGIKCILRVVYSDSQIGTTDAPLNIILQHIEQLKPILTDNADIIYVMQAGLIGAWGEWHTSSNSLDTNADAQKQILDGILGALPTSRHTQVRTPLFKESYVTLSGAAAPRVGHHNDCFLASSTDFGTYPSDAVDLWKNYVANDNHVLVGGETCTFADPDSTNPPRTDCDTAVTELAALHYTFLNGSPYGDTIDEWKTGGCYDNINNRLGYRFELQSAELNESVKPGELLHVKLTLKNSGFAQLQYSRIAYLLLKTNSASYAAPLALDLSTIDPSSTASVEVNATLPSDIAEGSYTLSLWIPDPASTLKNNTLYDIQLANKNGNIISSTMTIDATADTYTATANSTFIAQ